MRTTIAVALMATCAISSADVLITNYPPTNDSGVSAGLNTTRIKALGFVMPTTPYMLDSITVRLFFTTLGQTPVVTIRDTGSATAPGAVLHTLLAPGGYVTGAGDYTFAVDGSFLLEGSKKYWVAVGGATTASGMDWRGSSPAIIPTGPATHQGSLFTSNGGTTWANSATINTYQINATPVPEPASLAALGIGALALLRRRRR